MKSGALYAGTTIALTIFAPLWGSLSDRYGRKMMVVRSMASGAIIIFLMILVQNPQELLVLRILQGMLTGSIAASQALVAATVPRDRLGFAMGLMQTAQFFGSSIGPLIGGQLDASFGFEPTFLIASLMLLAATVMVIVLVDEKFVRLPVPQGAARRGTWDDARDIIANRQLALLILVLCVVQFGGQIVGPVLTVFVQDLGNNAQSAAAEAGNVFAIAGLGSAVTAVLAGRLTDRKGHFKLVLLLSTIATALATLPQAAVTSVNQLYILRGLVGLTMGAMLASSSAMLTMDTDAEHRGAVIGLSAGANAAGQAVGQLSGSGVASAFGIRSVFILTAGILGLVSAVVALFIREPVREESDGNV